MLNPIYIVYTKWLVDFFQVDVYFVFYIFSAIFGSMMGRFGSKGEDMEEQWHAAAAGKTSKVLRRQSLQELLHKKAINNEYSSSMWQYAVILLP